MRTEPSNKLPLVALLCVAVLILSGWLFFLATHELATINYERKNNFPRIEAPQPPANTNESPTPK